MILLLKLQVAYKNLPILTLKELEAILEEHEATTPNVTYFLTMCGKNRERENFSLKSFVKLLIYLIFNLIFNLFNILR